MATSSIDIDFNASEASSFQCSVTSGEHLFSSCSVWCASLWHKCHQHSFPHQYIVNTGSTPWWVVNTWLIECSEQAAFLDYHLLNFRSNDNRGLCICREVYVHDWFAFRSLKQSIYNISSLFREAKVFIGLPAWLLQDKQHFFSCRSRKHKYSLDIMCDSTAVQQSYRRRTCSVPDGNG